MEKYKKICLVFSILLINLTIFYFYFNRTPDRSKSEYTSDIILSPCDGTVTYSSGRNISVFLSPLDVHAQYCPIDSYIKNIEVIHGTKYMATKPESIHNEGVKVTFTSQYGDIEVTQRVGFFVRRIINNIKIGDIVKRGYNYGYITFGSRVDILLPENMKSSLIVNQKVYGGITKIV
tara:strand:+ start:166 stop:696 length:531 start_codon:yes stop_codon:yes gene_type:complete